MPADPKITGFYIAVHLVREDGLGEPDLVITPRIDDWMSTDRDLNVDRIERTIQYYAKDLAVEAMKKIES